MKFKKVVSVEVNHKPEYYNRTCRATIPEVWQAEVVGGIISAGSFDHIHIYGMGDTKQEAIKDVANQLQKIGFNGKIKVF